MFYVYQVLERWGGRRPLEPDSDGKLSHADMLRYDRGFCDPADPSRVVFPRFKGGRASITTARWSSFGLTLKSAGEIETTVIDDWYTFVHPPGLIRLEKKTFAEYMKENKLKLTDHQPKLLVF